MTDTTKEIIYIILAFLTAGIVSFAATPLVRVFAYKIGAIDVPKDNRRMHKKPIPRLGGLAIFFGFIISVLLFCNVKIDENVRGMLLGAVVIVILGIIDDIMALGPKLKFFVQILAALIPVLHGVRIDAILNLNLLSDNQYTSLGFLSIPLSVLWIVGITNAVNLIDGLDGLAAGVSSIASVSLLIITVTLGANPAITFIVAALAGSCIGFMPYNFNPARMFMGDTGATFLGFILACASIQGLFKSYMLVSFAVPFLILGLPIFDTAYAIIRRIATGHSPMSPDRGHLHHKLIDMGFSQKQAVAILYTISAILGLSAVLLTVKNAQRALIIVIGAFLIALLAAKIVLKKFRGADDKSGSDAENGSDNSDSSDNTGNNAEIKQDNVNEESAEKDINDKEKKDEHNG